MNELDDGNVVFFCGAGVSMGPESDLPSFDGLVDHVYSRHHLKPDAVEQAALRRCEFDKALGLLARPGRLGEQQLRRTVIERLFSPATRRLTTHKALITLSSHGTTGLRLVTTNFDNRFIEAGVDEGHVDAAPMLPLPKPHAWSSLVHLHGHISRGVDGTNLVLTAADFGRAYLSERWASRFIAELFREFTVVFIGYSLDDRVMSYLVDALAAERASGARFSTAYAFAPHDGTDSCQEAVKTDWLAKNVQPILYDKRYGHAYLSDTLIEWARIKTDPFGTRLQIVVDEMTKLPNRFSADRVTWALRDAVTAYALAEAPPATDEQDYPKVERWLDRFHKAGLLSLSAPDADDPPPRLVDGTQEPRHLGIVSWQLGRWIARHLHVPQVLTWVLQHGSRMHPRLRHQVRQRLADPVDPSSEDAIHPKLRHMWTIVCAEETVDRHRFLLLTEHLNVASEPERFRIAESAVASIAPRLVVRPGANWRARLRHQELSPTDSCAHIDVLAGNDDERHLVEPVLSDRNVLARYADALTGYLEHALSLLKEVDGVALSVSYRPSIADHDQNSGADDWTHLVDLVRDSYVAIAEHDRDRARHLLHRWMRSPYPLFKRLALHILTEDPRCDVHLAQQLLLEGSPPGLWHIETRREVLRFLRLAGRRLPPTLHTAVVRAIHATPKSNDGYGVSRAERAIRLHKLRLSGSVLDSRSQSLADERRPSHDVADDRDEFLGSHEFRWVGPGDSAPPTLLDGPANELVAALRGDHIQPNEFMGLAIRQQEKAAHALRALARSDEWKAEYWDYFLEGLAYLRRYQNLTDDVQEEAAELLLDAPDELIGSVRSVARFIEALAEQYDADQEPRFSALWNRAWKNVSTAEYTEHDPLGENCPAARLAQAAFERLWKYVPRDGYGFPAAVRNYFDAVVADLNGLPGRVVLASHLYDLFTIDPTWTKRNITDRLDPDESNEARYLWGGYARSAKIGPNLLAAMKDSFLKMLERYDTIHDRGKILPKLLVLICIDNPKELNPDRVRAVVDMLSEYALESVLSYLTVRMTGNADERASIWNAKVKSWLTSYWPSEGQRNTAATADEMMKLVMESGRAFPDAVSWALEVRAVQSIRRLLRLHRLLEPGYDHIKKHSDAVLRLLAGVVTQDSVMNGDKSLILRPIIKKLEGSNPALARMPELQKLQRFANE